MRIFLDTIGPGEGTPCEYHLSRRVLGHNRECSEGTRPSGDSDRNSSLLRHGLALDLPHPFHRWLFDASARAAVTELLATAIAQESAKAYRRIDGVLRSLYNEDRHMGPNSAVKHKFLFELQLHEGCGTDTFQGELRYRPQSGSFVARDPLFESHETRTDFVGFDCPVCRYACYVLAFEREASTLLDEFECPVCGYARAASDLVRYRECFAATVPSIPLAEIGARPAEYHLRKLLTAGTIRIGIEHAALYDRRLASTFPIWPRLSASCNEQLSRLIPTGEVHGCPAHDVTIEGIFKYAAVCSTAMDGRRWPRVIEHAESRGLVLTAVLSPKGFGHMGCAPAEFVITRLEGIGGA